MANAVYTKLPDRAFIIVMGNDKHVFLQGLITQDIGLLKSQDLIYSCLLTPNGKFLFDFFIFEDGETLVIDCEGGERASALLKRLSMFKLRSDVVLELVGDADVFQIFDGDYYGGVKDPRFDGYRAYPSLSFLRKQESHETDSSVRWDDMKLVHFNEWDERRIKAEIPDGSRDLIPEKSFIHESQIIIDTAVSYDKGCYMGQELVSRIYHRGLVKKQLRCVDVNKIPDSADMRSQCGDFGLALVKL